MTEPQAAPEHPGDASARTLRRRPRDLPETIPSRGHHSHPPMSYGPDGYGWATSGASVPAGETRGKGRERALAPAGEAKVCREAEEGARRRWANGSGRLRGAFAAATVVGGYTPADAPPSTFSATSRTRGTGYGRRTSPGARHVGGRTGRGLRCERRGPREAEVVRAYPGSCGERDDGDPSRDGAGPAIGTVVRSVIMGLYG